MSAEQLLLNYRNIYLADDCGTLLEPCIIIIILSLFLNYISEISLKFKSARISYRAHYIAVLTHTYSNFIWPEIAALPKRNIVPFSFYSMSIESADSKRNCGSYYTHTRSYYDENFYIQLINRLDAHALLFWIWIIEKRK